MMFTKLTLKNFKSHRNTVIDFKPGISIIVGKNGAGKSTILEAISFALFKQHSSKKIDDLVRITRGKSSNEMSVELEFISNGKEYRVIRDRGNLSKAKLLVKDNYKLNGISSGDTAVNKEIQSILEMDRDLFLNAIYIQQGEIANLVGKSPSEKKHLIGKLLGVGGLEKAWKNILPLINIYENLKSELEGRTASNLDLDSDLKSKKSSLENLKIKGNTIQKEIKDLDKLKALKLKEKSEMENTKNTFDKLNTQLQNENKTMKRVISDNKKFQAQLEDLESKKEKMNKLKKFSTKLPIFLDFSESLKNLEQIRKKQEQYQKKLDNIQEQKKILKNKKNEYNQYLEIQKKINDLNERKSKLERELAIIKELENNKGDIEKEIKEKNDKIKEFFNKTIKSLNIEIEDFHELRRIVTDFKAEAKKKINKIDEKLSSNSQEISRLKEGIKSAEESLDEITKVDNKCPVCKSNITEDKKNSLFDSYKDKIKSNNESLDKINKVLKKTKNEKKVFEDKIGDLKVVEDKISENIHLSNLINNDLEKIKKIDNKLKGYNYSQDKIDNVLLSIKDQNKLQEISKESHDKYVHAQGSLDALGKEDDTKDKLKELMKNEHIEAEKIKLIMVKDSYLSSDIEVKDLKEKIEELKDKDKKYNQLKGEILQIPILQSQIKNKIKEQDSIRSKIDDIKNRVKANRYNEDMYKSIVLAYECSEKKLKELNKEINEIKGKATEIITNIQDLNIKKKQNNILKKKLENIKDYLQILKEIRVLYSRDGVQKELRNRSKPLIQKHTKDFFEQFNFDYVNLKIDDEYNVSVFDTEGEHNLDMLSGGEKIAIALALRLGITKAISKGNIETILLDEPTIHLDSYRRHELIYFLRKMSTLPQMIIVTHDSELEDAFDNIIKIQKENGISNVVSA